MNIIIDYFQPINRSHIQVAQKLYEKNGKASVFIAVFHNDLPKRYPIPESIVNTLLTKAKENNPIIVDYFIVHDWNLSSILEKIKGKYFPSVIACTTKRIKDYSLQLEFYLKYDKASPYKKSILIEVDHNDFGDSLRESLFNKDLETFKSKTPEFVHSYFDKLVPYYKQEYLKESDEDKQILSDHFNFFKMVINSDATVQMKSSIIEVFDNAKKRINLQKEEDIIVQHCINRGFTEVEAIEFFTKVILKFEESVILDFIEKLNDGVDINYNTSIVSLGERITPELFKSLIEFKPAKRDNFGSGEFLTSILFSNALKADFGDVMITGRKIEVKNNESQLLSIKQSNEAAAFGELSSSAKFQTNLLIHRLSQHKQVSLNLRNHLKLTYTNSKYNISQRGIANYIKLGHAIVVRYPFSHVPVSQWLTDLFIGGVFADESIVDEFRESLTEKWRMALNNEITPKEILSYLTYIAFKYYSRVDYFKGMLIFRSNLKNLDKLYCGYISSDTSYEDYIKIIEPVSGPSISDPRTSKVFKIRLKSVDK